MVIVTRMKSHDERRTWRTVFDCNRPSVLGHHLCHDGQP